MQCKKHVKSGRSLLLTLVLPGPWLQRFPNRANNANLGGYEYICYRSHGCVIKSCTIFGIVDLLTQKPSLKSTEDMSTDHTRTTALKAGCNEEMGIVGFKWQGAKYRVVRVIGFEDSLCRFTFPAPSDISVVH